MRVAGFMKPANQVITVKPTDSIRKAMDLMLEHKVGAVVVVATTTATGTYTVPIGIVTKTDLVKAYHDELTTLDHPVKEIMTKGDKLATCTETMSRDQAARVLERNQNHHAIVIDPETKQFVGLVSSWDITVECAKDDRAWPWNRSEDGRFHNPSEKQEMGTSPTSAFFHPTGEGHPNLGDSFREYIDHLGYFD